jgi:hypothetical protein
MFISDDLAFIELHKTGCTHIGKLLASLVCGVQYGKHNPLGPDIIQSGRNILGSIRNPWDWYVSLWAYGCDRKGFIYHLTTRPLAADEQGASLPAIVRNRPPAQGRDLARKPEKWKRCYSDVHSASAFRDWLHMMNNADYWFDFGEGYGDSSISAIAGLLTYRYIKLFCRDVDATITSVSGLKAYERQNCFIDYFIRTEYLENDFLAALKSCKISISESQKRSVLSAERTNISTLRRVPAYYYDEESIKLVREREGMITDKFSYMGPSS